MAFNKGKKGSGMETGYLTGKAFFARVHTPDSKYNKYVLQLALEGEELKKAQAYNLKIKPASKHVGFPHVEIKRNVKGPQTKPPKVTDHNNSDLDKSVMIGNNSLVKVKFAMYDYQGKNMAYLDTVKVMNLVPFVSGADQEEAEFMAVDNTGTVPDDEIPFDSSPKREPVKTKSTTTG